MNMPKRFVYFIALAVLVTVPLVISYCSGEGESGDSEAAGGPINDTNAAGRLPEYTGWTKYTYKTFVYHFRRDASWRDRMHGIAQAFENALKTDCEFFGKPCPEGPIHVFMYNSPEEAEILLGKDVPYVVGNQIHWDRVANPYGAGIMIYLLDYWEMPHPRYDFLKEGIIALRDYSKRNYHALTGKFIDDGTFIPAAILLDNAAYNEKERQIRSWEAASFVAFITGTLGVDKFLDLWESGQTFEEFLQHNSGTGLNQFEQVWMQYTIDQYNNSDLKSNGE